MMLLPDGIGFIVMLQNGVNPDKLGDHNMWWRRQLQSIQYIDFQIDGGAHAAHRCLNGDSGQEPGKDD